MVIVVPVTLITMIAVLFDVCNLGDKNPITLLWKVVYVAALILTPLAYAKWRVLLTRFALLPTWLALRAKYRSALFCNRFVFYPPSYGESQRGWILLEAGRFDDALAVFKPLAFECRSPQLRDWSLAFYGTILVINKDFETAQRLFEAATDSESPPGKFHMALADCLMAQRKDVERARELIEAVLAAGQRLGSGSERAENASKIAMHALSLAYCRINDRAEARLQEAQLESAQLDRRNLASVYLVAGLTWRELGNLERSRAALLEAKGLWPFGELAIRIHRKLIELDSGA